MKFINYLLKNNIDNKLYMLGFFICIITYSLWRPIEETFRFSEENAGAIYYLGIALGFCCYTSAYMFSKWDSWRWFPMVVFFICVSRVLNELWFIYHPEDNPEEYSIMDYISFLITIWIVFNYYIKWRFEKFNSKE